MWAQKALTKVFGSRNERLLKRYRKIVAQVNAMEPKIQLLGDAQLKARALEIRSGAIAGTIKSADIMAEGFAIVRESMDRNIGIRQIFNPDENFDPDQLDDAMLEAYDSVQRQMISTGVPWQKVAIPQEIYAAVRKLYPESRPPFRARCFDVQLIGGLVLYESRIAEMATGEGKTFVAPLACFMRVLEGSHCHVVTVNDYLVRRDASWIRPAFEALGFSVGYIQHDMEPGGDTRRKMYQCDVTYGTNSEFGFDYLRDNMKERLDLQVQGPLDFAIVDEIDSILIDEARTPLIISGPAHDEPEKYRKADAVVRKIIDLNRPYDAIDKEVDAARRQIKSAEGDEDKAKNFRDKVAIEAARQRKADATKLLAETEAKKSGLTQYYEVEPDKKSAHLTHIGIAKAQEAAGVGSFYVGNNIDWPHLLEQSLRAHAVYERDRDYVVERGQRGTMEVVIVDEYTGRKMPGRQWSDGLHQACEAKERVPIKEETQTMATITLQNFFKMYKSLSGMTGTAMTESEEFMKIYQLEVVGIPTNRKRIRDDSEDRIYRTEREKWDAIIEEIREVSLRGRPVLVGTTSVDKSEMLSQMLHKKYGIEHDVLNAKNHEREASIVAGAGQQAQNKHSETVGVVTIATNMAGRGTDIKLAKGALEAGGLHVIGTERHTARRVDNQLRGRSGRQGDPGSSRFFVSLQDDLMKMFAGEWTIKVLSFLGMQEGEPIEDKRISKGIERAQRKVEERNYLARKNLLEYDEVMERQRSTFYGMRQRVLRGQEVDGVIWEMIGQSIHDAVDRFIEKDYVAHVVAEWTRTNYEIQIDAEEVRGMHEIRPIEDYIKEQARNDLETQLSSTLGEFFGDDQTDQSLWDVQGLAQWARNRYNVNVSPAELRRLTPDQIEDQIRRAAVVEIEARDVSPLIKYLEPLYAQHELSNWAREKFGITVDAAEMIEDKRDNRTKEPAAIARLIEDRARAAYSRREVEYPVEHVLGLVFGGENGNTDDPYGAETLRQWLGGKYGVDMSADHIRTRNVRQLRDELIGLQGKVLEPAELKASLDTIAPAAQTPAEFAKAFTDRFGLKFQASAFVPPTGKQRTTREQAIVVLRGLMRRELTDLEQAVLIQILDQSWKDHLYAMDMLKSGIGLQSFAEKDPRILYKKEGFRFFQEMMVGVRDKVTDLIFKARLSTERQAPPPPMPALI